MGSVHEPRYIVDFSSINHEFPCMQHLAIIDLSIIASLTGTNASIRHHSYEKCIWLQSIHLHYFNFDCIKVISNQLAHLPNFTFYTKSYVDSYIHFDHVKNFHLHSSCSRPFERMSFSTLQSFETICIAWNYNLRPKHFSDDIQICCIELE